MKLRNWHMAGNRAKAHGAEMDTIPNYSHYRKEGGLRITVRSDVVARGPTRQLDLYLSVEETIKLRDKLSEHLLWLELQALDAEAKAR